MLEKEELLSIYGGVNWNSTFINALVRGANLFLEIGRSVGSAARRLINGKVCSM